MSYYDKAKDIYDMLAQGKLLDAFEKYYHNDVVMVEATGEERKGKEPNRKFQVDFMSMIKEMHGSGVRAITSDEKKATTMVESWMDVTMKDYSEITPEKASVVIRSFVDTIKAVNGEFVSVWHNESFDETGRWKGWRKVYEDLLAYAAGMKNHE